MAALTLTCGAAVTATFAPGFMAPETVIADEMPALAKVGDTEYATIDEAIAAWTNGTTLTLLSDVMLTDVITMKSTEHHILNLGTYTMTAATSKHAIEITCNDRSSASYALTINADATNPGGITATGKSCIYYNKTTSTKDRPIILINNGVFNGSYALNFNGKNGNTNCPQAWINGGTFNGNVNLTKCMMKISGGTFNGWIYCTGDSSAYRYISGGTFKSWQFLTADAASKFGVGSNWDDCKAEIYNGGVYVDDNGYLVVGGDTITSEDGFEAKASYSSWSSCLEYSSAKANGLYHKTAKTALVKSGNVTVFTDEIDLTNLSPILSLFNVTSLKGTVLLENSSDQLTVKFNEAERSKVPATLIKTNVDDHQVVYEDTVVNGVVTRSYAIIEDAVVAKVNDAYFKGDELFAMVAAIEENATVTLYNDINLFNEGVQPMALTTATLQDGVLTLPAGVTINANGNTVTGSVYAEEALTINGDLTIDGTFYVNNELTLNGKVTPTTLYVGAEASLGDGSTGAFKNPVNYYEMKEVNFTLTTDKAALKANECVNVTVSISEAYYSAEYTFTYDTTKFACTADIDGDGVIFVTGLYQGVAGALATYNFVAKNDITSVYEGEEFEVNGNVVEYAEQALTAIKSTVVGDTASVKISLDYTAGIVADYVSGYTLVLVKGADGGYAYNGNKMFFVQAYDAYAYIVEGAVTEADIDAAISKTTGCEVIAPSYNVNAEYVQDGLVDLKDATAVYACSIIDFTVEEYVELYLRADVNGDGKVNVVDINEVVKNYTK